MTFEVIRTHRLGKVFPLFQSPADRLKEIVLRSPRSKPFWALRDVNLQIAKGEGVGVLGRNCSGKSTLLQLICGITRPSIGELWVDGRVAPVMALGGSFDPESTGRTNAVIAGVILGLKRHEVLERLDSIVEFAGLGDFLDQPVKKYSAGMRARLAFAVCAHVDADILVVDEALAVGDGAFQKQCLDWLGRFCQTGTLLFVSHSLDDVLHLCRKAVWLDRGRVREIGDPYKVGANFSKAMELEPDDPSRFQA